MKRSASDAALDEEAACPGCGECWDVNEGRVYMPCCCRRMCEGCMEALTDSCPLCTTRGRRTRPPATAAAYRAQLARHVARELPAALVQLGTLHASGALGLEQSYEEAARLWARAADLGDVAGMFSVGFAYDQGRGVAVDKARAAAYYRMAADRGHAHAQCNLGTYFAQGIGVARDRAEAFRLTALAAAQGLTLAEYCLGMFLDLGIGVPRDAEAARPWYERAAAKGCAPAERWLAVDRKRGLRLRLDALEAAVAAATAKGARYRAEVDALRARTEALAARAKDAASLVDTDRAALVAEGVAVREATLAVQAKYEAELVALDAANRDELREILRINDAIHAA